MLQVRPAQVPWIGDGKRMPIQEGSKLRGTFLMHGCVLMEDGMMKTCSKAMWRPPTAVKVF